MSDQERLRIVAVHLARPFRSKKTFKVLDGWDISLDPNTGRTMVEKDDDLYGIPEANVCGWDLERYQEEAPKQPGLEEAEAWLDNAKPDDPQLRERQAVVHRFKDEKTVDKLTPTPGASWDEAEGGDVDTDTSMSPKAPSTPSAPPVSSSSGGE